MVLKCISWKFLLVNYLTCSRIEFTSIKRIIPQCELVFKCKKDAWGQIEKYKPELVTNDYNRRKIDDTLCVKILKPYMV